jgi:MSHA biogenesis protein MshP
MSSLYGKHGFGLIAAIFVLLVLASAGAMMLNLSGTQRKTTVLALQGNRAYRAAITGIEWGVFQAINNGPACPATTTLSLTEGGLQGFDVTLSCTSSEHSESGVSSRTYELTSISEYGTYDHADYVRRRVMGTITDAP